jgi:hypothetical protein
VTGTNRSFSFKGESGIGSGVGRETGIFTPPETNHSGVGACIPPQAKSNKIREYFVPHYSLLPFRSVSRYLSKFYLTGGQGTLTR